MQQGPLHAHRLIGQNPGMRLYLASFRLGPHHERLRRLAGGGRRTALIPNAVEHVPTEDRIVGLRRDVDELEATGLEVTLLDLREPGAVDRLADFDIVWVRGGNVFVLRRALAHTGADSRLINLLERDVVVYGGYSAGPCVLGPDLTALRRVDDLDAVAEPITDGLGLLDRPFVPHVRSPAHPESAGCDAVAADYQTRGQAHWALRDGQVLIIDGDEMTLL